MRLVLCWSEKWGMLPSTILLCMKVESNSGPTPLNITPRKSLSVFSMPCFMAKRCTCFTPSVLFSTFIIESPMAIGWSMAEDCRV